MLQAMRSGAHSQIIKFVFFGLLILGVGGLVFSDIGGFFRGGVSKTDVAAVGKENIGLRRFDMQARSILGRQGLDPQAAFRLGYIDQILMGEIQEILLKNGASDFGILISDEDVAAHIARLVEPMLDEDTTPQQALNRIVASQGITERQFVNSIRSQLAISFVNGALQSGAMIVPAGLAKNLYMFDHEKRLVEYFVIREKDFSDVEKPGEDDLEKFYEATRNEYVIPERRAFSIALIDAGSIAGSTEIPDDELLSLYEENIDSYRLPEKRKMAQAIAETRDVAQAIYDKASAGTPLQTAVLEVTGSKDSYQDVQSFEKDGLIENIAEVAFALEAGNVAPPVQTPLGWHVLKVTEIEEGKTQSFAAVKDELRKYEEQNAAADRLYELAGEIDDMIAGGAGFEETVAAFGLDKKTVAPVDISGADEKGKQQFEDWGDDKELLLETGFSLVAEEISPVTELANGSFAVIKADSVEEQSWKPMKDVARELESKWVSREQKLLVMQATDTALTKLERGEPFEKVAKEAGYEVKSVTLDKQGEPGKIFDASTRIRFFPLGAGETASAGTSGGQVVGRVTKVSLPDGNDIKAGELDKYEQALQRVVQSDIRQAYVDSLARKYGVKINSALLKKVYGGQEHQGDF